MPKNLLLLLLTLLFSVSSLLLITIINTHKPEQKNNNLVFGTGINSKNRVLGTNTVIFNPTEDTYTDSSTPNSTYESVTIMKTKHYTPSGPDAKSFLKFNLDPIQANSTISSAVLKLQLYSCYGEPTSPAWITVAQANTDWSAATLTWNTMPGTASQRNFPEAADCPASPPQNKGYVNMEVAYLVQQWVNGEKPDYGFIVLNVASSSTYWKMWSTNESSFKPQLEVTWTTPPDTTPPTPPASDTTAPVISSVAAKEIGKNSAIITWTTDEVSSSFVDYGPTTSYGSSAGQTDSVTNHQVTLSGLEADETFHFRVKSKDAADNETASGDFSFKTLSSSQTTSASDASKAGDLEKASTLSSTASATKSAGQTEKGKSSVLKLALIVIAVLLVVLLTGLAFYLWQRKKKANEIKISSLQGNNPPAQSNIPPTQTNNQPSSENNQPSQITETNEENLTK